MRTAVFTMRFNVPQAADLFGRWCEKHNIAFDCQCMLGQWHVTASRKLVHGYSDDAGSHSESWQVTRQGRDFGETLHEALRAIARSTGIEAEFNTLVEVTQ